VVRSPIAPECPVEKTDRRVPVTVQRGGRSALCELAEHPKDRGGGEVGGGDGADQLVQGGGGGGPLAGVLGGHRDANE